MKQKYFLAIVIVTSLVLSSCSTFTYTSRSTSINKTEIAGVEMLVDVRPDFSKRIVTESGLCKSISIAKEEAKYHAVVDNNCDVIVDPVYKIQKIGLQYRAFLTGFAGFYKNPRTLYEDIKLLKDIKRSDIEKYLILKDPNILELINPANQSEIINIYDGKVVETDQEKCSNKEEKTEEEPKKTTSYNKRKK